MTQSEDNSSATAMLPAWSQVPGVSSSARAKGQAVSIAWAEGRALEAFELLASEFSQGSPVRKAVAALREIRPKDLNQSAIPIDAQQAEARQRLVETSDKVTAPSGSDHNARLLWLAEQCRKNPRLAWLEDSMREIVADTAEKQPLRVAVLGEFNAGKSSLINALLGHDILRTGIVPVTASLTELRYGDAPQAKVRLHSGEERSISFDGLATMTDEREADGLARAVERITLSFPAAFLKQFTILDTPGFNSGFDLHELVTERVIQSADVVLWMFNATKAGSETETKELRHVERSVGKAIGILNHIDDIDPSFERRPHEWQRRLDGVIEDVHKKFAGLIERWVPVSALWIRENHPKSGRALLVEALDDLALHASEYQAAACTRRRDGLARTALALETLQSEEAAEFERHQEQMAVKLAYAAQTARRDLQLEAEYLSARRKFRSPGIWNEEARAIELVEAVLEQEELDRESFRHGIRALQALEMNVALFASPLCDVWMRSIKHATLSQAGLSSPRVWWFASYGDVIRELANRAARQNSRTETHVSNAGNSGVQTNLESSRAPIDEAGEEEGGPDQRVFDFECPVCHCVHRLSEGDGIWEKRRVTIWCPTTSERTVVPISKLSWIPVDGQGALEDSQESEEESDPDEGAGEEYGEMDELWEQAEDEEGVDDEDYDPDYRTDTL